MLPDAMIEAFKQFPADAGGMQKEFCCDCDQKLLGDQIRRWIYKQESKIIGAPAGRQSSTVSPNAPGPLSLPWLAPTSRRNKFPAISVCTPYNMHVA